MVQPLRPLIKGSDVRSFEHTPGGTVQFAHGDDHGLGTMTVAISNSPPGGGAAEHRHPCGEVFVVYSGRGVYTVGGVDVIRRTGRLGCRAATYLAFLPSRWRHAATAYCCLRQRTRRYRVSKRASYCSLGHARDLPDPRPRWTRIACRQPVDHIRPLQRLDEDDLPCVPRAPGRREADKRQESQYAPLIPARREHESRPEREGPGEVARQWFHIAAVGRMSRWTKQRGRRCFELAVRALDLSKATRRLSTSRI